MAVKKPHKKQFQGEHGPTLFTQAVLYNFASPYFDRIQWGQIMSVSHAADTYSEGHVVIWFSLKALWSFLCLEDHLSGDKFFFLKDRVGWEPEPAAGFLTHIYNF